MENNADLRFPDGREPYYAGWSGADASRIPVLDRERLIADLKRALEPAPREQIVMLLTRLAAHFWNDKGESQWKIVFEDYASDLAEIPADIVAEGVKRYRQTGKFWPKISELLAIMKPLCDKRKVQLHRLLSLSPAKEPERKLSIVPTVKRFGGTSGEAA